MPQMKVDILAFGAHPDDIELGCGGSIALAIAQGKTVGMIDLTAGELGTRGSAEIRAQEATNAAALLEVSFRKNLGFCDAFFVNDEIHQRSVIQQIRTHQPSIVLCNAIEDRHIDHGKGSKLVSDACFLAGLQKIETQDEQGNPQLPWRPLQVYHYIQWKDIHPDFVVLVLVDFINRNRRLYAMGARDAVIDSGMSRFRPIFLTSVTTFMGLLPLMVTRDFDTAPFVPLAVSLGFGVVFATAITLILIPALYMILDDFLSLFSDADETSDTVGSTPIEITT